MNIFLSISINIVNNRVGGGVAMGRKIKNIVRLVAVLVMISTALLFYNSEISLAQVLLYQTIPNHNFSLFARNGTQNIISGDLDDFVLFFDTMYQEEAMRVLGIHDIEEHSFRALATGGAGVAFSNEDINNFRNTQRFLNRFFSMDTSTGIIDSYFDIDYFLNANLRVEHDPTVPQVLIFHTHAASEFFIDSPSTNNIMEGIVGVGATLADVLQDKYNINVIHYVGVYDRVNGQIARMGAYERIEPSIQKILAENPTIELVLDLHRDGVPETTNRNVFTSYINGNPTASIMFVNGVSAIAEGNNVRRLNHIANPHTRDNLALSFNLQMAAWDMFSPNFTRRIYLTPFRYINHLRPRSALVEVGTQLSTRQEAHNAMEPLADIIYSVIFAKGE